jgi:hypothetical protein
MYNSDCKKAYNFPVPKTKTGDADVPQIIIKAKIFTFERLGQRK